jgi:hypothetical protein
MRFPTLNPRARKEDREIDFLIRYIPLVAGLAKQDPAELEKFLKIES